MKSLILIYCLGLLFSSCTRPGTAGDTGPYFDTKTWFESRLGNLENSDAQLEKTVNSQVAVRMENPVWEKELGPFLSYDLAHPAKSGKYTVEESSAGNLRHLVYRAVDKKATLRSVEVIRSNEDVLSIHIIDETSNLMYTSHKELRFYNDNQRWQVDHNQTSRWFSDTHYMIDVKVLYEKSN